MTFWPLPCCKKPQFNPVSHEYPNLLSQYGGVKAATGQNGFARHIDLLAVAGNHQGLVVDNPHQWASLCNSAGVTIDGRLYVWAGKVYDDLRYVYSAATILRRAEELQEDDVEPGGDSADDLVDGLVRVGADTDWAHVSENEASPGEFLAIKRDGSVWSFGDWQSGVDVRDVGDPSPYAFRAKLSCSIARIDSSLVNATRDRLFLPAWFTAVPTGAGIAKLRWDERDSRNWQPGDVSVAQNEPGGGCSIRCVFLGQVDTGAIRGVQVDSDPVFDAWKDRRFPLSFEGRDGSGEGAEAWAYTDAEGSLSRVEIVRPGSGYKHPVSAFAPGFPKELFIVDRPRGVVVDYGGQGYLQPPPVRIVPAPGELQAASGAQARVTKMRKVGVQEFVVASGGRGYTQAFATEKKTGAIASAVVLEGVIQSFVLAYAGNAEHSPLDEEPLQVEISGDGVGASAVAVAQGSSIEEVTIYANPAVWTKPPLVEFDTPDGVDPAVARVEGIIGRAHFDLLSPGQGYTKSSMNIRSNTRQPRAVFSPCAVVTPSNGEVIGGRHLTDGRVIAGEAILVPGAVVAVEENPEEFFNKNYLSVAANPPSPVSAARFVASHRRWAAGLRIASPGLVNGFQRFVAIDGNVAFSKTEFGKVPPGYWREYIEQCVSANLRSGGGNPAPIAVTHYAAFGDGGNVVGVSGFSVTNSGRGYTWATATERTTGATATATIENGRVVAWVLTYQGQPQQRVDNPNSLPLLVTVEGDGTGAAATATRIPGATVSSFFVKESGKHYTQATATESVTGATAQAVVTPLEIDSITGEITGGGRIIGWVMTKYGKALPSPVRAELLNVTVSGDGSGGQAAANLTGPFGVGILSQNPVPSESPPVLSLEFKARPHRVTLEGIAVVADESWDAQWVGEGDSPGPRTEEWTCTRVSLLQYANEETTGPTWGASPEDAFYDTPVTVSGPNGATAVYVPIDGKLVEQSNSGGVGDRSSVEPTVSGGQPYLGPIIEVAVDDPATAWSQPSDAQRIHFLFNCEGGTPARAISSPIMAGVPRLSAIQVIDRGFGYTEEPNARVVSTRDPFPQRFGIDAATSAGFVNGVAFATVGGSLFWWGRAAAVVENRLRSIPATPAPSDADNLLAQHIYRVSNSAHAKNYTAKPTAVGGSLQMRATGFLASAVSDGEYFDLFSGPSTPEPRLGFWRWPRPDHGNRLAFPIESFYPRSAAEQESEIGSAIGTHAETFPATVRRKPWNGRESAAGAGYSQGLAPEYVGPATIHEIAWRPSVVAPSIVRVGERFLLDSDGTWRRFLGGATPYSSERLSQVHIPPLVALQKTTTKTYRVGAPSAGVRPCERWPIVQVTTSEIGQKEYPEEFVAVVRSPGIGGQGVSREDSSMSDRFWDAGVRQALLVASGGVRAAIESRTETRFDNEIETDEDYAMAVTTTETEDIIEEIVLEPGPEQKFHIYLSSNGGLPSAVFPLGVYVTPPSCVLLGAGAGATVEVLPRRQHTLTDEFFPPLTLDELARDAEPHRDLAINREMKLCRLSAIFQSLSPEFLTEAESAVGVRAKRLASIPPSIAPVVIPYSEEIGGDTYFGIGLTNFFVVVDEAGVAYTTYTNQDISPTGQIPQGYTFSAQRLSRIVGPLRRLAPLAVATTDTGYGFDYPVKVAVTQPEDVAEGVCEIDGRLAGVAIVAGGRGYSQKPTIAFADRDSPLVPLAEVSAEADIAGPVARVILTATGQGYRTPPKVSFQTVSGYGSQAKATASILGGKVVGIAVEDGGRYRNAAPLVQIQPDYDIEQINVSNGGSGYHSAPDVIIDGGGGKGAIARSRISAQVVEIEVLAKGGPYLLPPDVYIITDARDTGYGATARAVLSSDGLLESVEVVSPGQDYQKPPAVLIPGGAMAVAKIEGPVVSVEVVDRGAGYETSPQVLFSGGGGQGAEAVASVAAVGSGATAVAELDGEIVSVTVTEPGEFLQYPPFVFAQHAEPLDGVYQIAITSGGSGYTHQPAVSLSGGGGSGAAAVAIVAEGRVAAIVVAAGGSGYSSPPQVSISGGGGSGATAKASLRHEVAEFAKLKATILGSPHQVDVTTPGDGYREPLMPLSETPGDGRPLVPPATGRRLTVFGKGSFCENQFAANPAFIESAYSTPRYRHEQGYYYIGDNAFDAKGRMNLRESLGLAVVTGGGPSPVSHVVLPKTVVGFKITSQGSGYAPYSRVPIRIVTDGPLDEAFRAIWLRRQSGAWHPDPRPLDGDLIGYGFVGPTGEIIAAYPFSVSAAGRGFLDHRSYTSPPDIAFDEPDDGGSGAAVQAVLGHPLECYYAPQVLFDGSIEVEADVSLTKCGIAIERERPEDRPPNYKGHEIPVDCFCDGPNDPEWKHVRLPEHFDDTQLVQPFQSRLLRSDDWVFRDPQKPAIAIKIAGELRGIVPLSDPLLWTDEEAVAARRPAAFFSHPPVLQIEDESGHGAEVSPIGVGPLSLNAIDLLRLTEYGEDYTLAARLRFYGGIPLARSAVPAAAATVAASGVITEVSLTNPGAGHTVPPAVYIVGDGSGAEAVVLPEDINPDTGEVLRVTLTRPGSGYTTARVEFFDRETAAQNNPRVKALEDFIASRYSVLLRNAKVEDVSLSTGPNQINVNTINAWGSDINYDPWVPWESNFRDRAFLHAAGIRLHNVFLEDGYVSYARVVGHQGQPPDLSVGIPVVTISHAGLPPYRPATAIANSSIFCDNQVFSGTAMQVATGGGSDFPPWQLLPTPRDFAQHRNSLSQETVTKDGRRFRVRGY